MSIIKKNLKKYKNNIKNIKRINNKYNQFVLI